MKPKSEATTIKPIDGVGADADGGKSASELAALVVCELERATRVLESVGFGIRFEFGFGGFGYSTEVIFCHRSIGSGERAK